MVSSVCSLPALRLSCLLTVVPNIPLFASLQKVSQLTDVLEARELRLLELSQQNAALVDTNSSLTQSV